MSYKLDIKSLMQKKRQEPELQEDLSLTEVQPNSSLPILNQPTTNLPNLSESIEDSVVNQPRFSVAQLIKMNQEKLRQSKEIQATYAIEKKKSVTHEDKLKHLKVIIDNIPEEATNLSDLSQNDRDKLNEIGVEG